MAVTGTVVLLMTGCASGRYERTLGQYADDKMLVRNVKEALDEQPVYKFPDVNVNTYRGVVQLSGFVASEAQRNAAAEIAQNIPGVVRVHNDVRLAPLPAGNATARIPGRSTTATNEAGNVGAPGTNRDIQTGNENGTRNNTSDQR